MRATKPFLLSLSLMLLLSGIVVNPALAADQPGITLIRPNLCQLGRYKTLASGVSGDGKVVIGSCYEDINHINDFNHAFIWSEETGMLTLWYSGDRPHSTVTGISEDGSVVVGYTEYNRKGFRPPGELSYEAFIWTPETGMMGLGTIGGSAYSRALAVSDDGYVVVGTAAARAFVWTPETEMLPLASVLDGWQQEATGVSKDGSVIVGHVVVGDLEKYVVRWNGDDRSGAPLGFNGEARAISADGKVIVGLTYDGAVADSPRYAFRWTQDEGRTLLGPHPGVSTAVSKDGSVIVGYTFGLHGVAARAFRWTTEKGFAYVDEWLDSLGVVVDSIELSDARGVSHDGSVVVGSGSGLAYYARGIPILNEEIRWTGAESTDWDLEDNWDPEEIPTSDSIVIIDTIAPHTTVLTGHGNAATLTVGNADDGNVTVTSGGTLTTGQGVIGGQKDSVGLVLVDGEDSKWNNSDAIYVGNRGTGMFGVSNGASATTGSLTLGLESGSSGTANVFASGDIDTQTLVVGERGDGRLELSEHGVINSRYATVGSGTGSDGIVTIKSNAAWSIFTDLIVGDEGTASVTVEKTGLILADAISVAEGDQGRGTVQLSGSNAAIHTGMLQVGVLGEGQIAVLAGAALGSERSYLGVLPEGGGQVTVDGTGATWDVRGELDVGRAGRGYLVIKNGGLVNAAGQTVMVAREESALGGIVIGDPAAEGGTAPGRLAAKEVVFGEGLTSSLTFNHTGTDYVFQPDIRGIGDIEHHAGTTTLTGELSDFAGTTRVKGGRLIINGNLGGSLDWSGGTIGGTGTLPAVNVPDDATISPGNSIGTLKVAEITFEPGSTYEVEVNAEGESDLIAASGEATLGGGLVVVIPSPDYTVDLPYTILTAEGGVTGTFDASAASEGFTFINTELAYEPNAVKLLITSSGVEFTSVAQTPNQKSVAAAIGNLSADDTLRKAVALLGSSSAREAFGQLSGDIHASIQTALIDETEMVHMAVQSRASGGVGSSGVEISAGSQGLDLGSGIWARLIRAGTAWQGTGNAAPYERSVAGGVVGRGFVSGDWLFGVMGGLAYGNHQVSAVNSSAGSVSTHVGAYAERAYDRSGALGNSHSWIFRTGLTYSAHRLRTERQVQFSGIAETHLATYDARTTGLFASLEYELQQDKYTLYPFATLSWYHVGTGGFSEHGDGHGAGQPVTLAANQAVPMTVATPHTPLTSLQSAPASFQTTIVDVGVRAERDFQAGSLPGYFYGGIGWRLALGDSTPRVGIALANGGYFETAGVPIGQGLSLDAGVRLSMTETMSALLSYESHPGGAADHRLTIGLQMSF